MAKDVHQGAVDTNLRVSGVDKLRVINVSVIHIIPECQIQNAVYMIGEKASVPKWTTSLESS